MLHDTTSRGRHVDDIKATLGDMRATRGDIIRFCLLNCTP